ncbi:hypothetical protein B296_00025451 [Ensete ventricosum]|uniref:Uncharacterized protein n=1 Tax=Ensete ventricosum TaxID=4639 RepID=A0A426YZ85_ENSVE|nr:hypothetical protein B296_00025451 [Ensete ventricosum]
MEGQRRLAVVEEVAASVFEAAEAAATGSNGSKRLALERATVGSRRKKQYWRRRRRAEGSEVDGLQAADAVESRRKQRRSKGIPAVATAGEEEGLAWGGCGSWRQMGAAAAQAVAVEAVVAERRRGCGRQRRQAGEAAKQEWRGGRWRRSLRLLRGDPAPAARSHDDRSCRGGVWSERLLQQGRQSAAAGSGCGCGCGSGSGRGGRWQGGRDCSRGGRRGSRDGSRRQQQREEEEGAAELGAAVRSGEEKGDGSGCGHEGCDWQRRKEGRWAAVEVEEVWGARVIRLFM